MTIQDIYRIYRSHPVVTTDTRNCKPGAMFFALKGDYFDGNNFVDEALQKGCEYAICDRTDIPGNDRIIRVKDSLETLQELACYHRRQLKTPVIAITGTNGKTTTKELINATLSTQYAVLSTQGNLNNHIGVPLTLLQLTPEHEYAVIEMGANHPGEIRQLAEIAEPDYGLITNIGKAHLEGFGSFDGVIRTKSELFDYLRKTNGKIFINRENSILAAIAHDLNTVTYGVAPGSFVWGNTISAFPYLTFEWNWNNQSFGTNTQLVGAYNLENVLAAVAVAAYFNVNPLLICKAIETYCPKNNRSQFQETANNRLIIDTYNANPSSMQAALENFSRMDVSPKMAILGSMKELGKYSFEEHKKVAVFIENAGFDRIMLCGTDFFSLEPKNGKWFASTEDMIHFLQQEPVRGYHILIKGSRGNQLEKTIGCL